MKECSLISLNRTQLTIRLSKTGKIEMKIRNQRLSIITATLLCLAVVPQSANAIWYIDRLSIDEGLTTVDRMLGEDLLQVRSDVYYKVDVAQIESTPQAAGTISAPVEVAKYAVVLDGVIDKIINWDGFSENEDLSENAVIIKLPKGDGVTYIDEKGVLRLSAIYQGSIVSAQVSPTELVTPKVGLVEKAPLTEPTPPVGTPVPFENAPQVTSQKVAADNSVSMTIQVPTVNVPANSTVHVQVVTDGRSTTSIGIDPNTPSTTVTVNNLPQNENVTVKTVITDTVTNKETVIINPVVTTIPAPIVTPEPARNPAVDKATVAAPAVTSSTTDATGHRVVDIKTPVIPDYDPTKSVASLMVVGPGGSTTSIGLFGSGETLSVGSLSPDASYTVKIVIRDLGSGKETIISGEQISKGVNP
jgi:hypothetical protein